MSRQGHWHMNTGSAYDEDEEASLRLAIELNAEWNHRDAFTASDAEPPSGHDLDGDLALAMHLDAELNLADRDTLSTPGRTAGFENSFIATGPDEVHLRGGGKRSSSEHRGSLQRSHNSSSYYNHSSSHGTSSNKFKTFDEFVSYILARRCAGCKKRVIKNEKHVLESFKGWLMGTTRPISSVLECESCAATACIGCGSKSTGNKPAHEVKVDHKFSVTWCCSRGRVFLIWVLLCGLDQQYCDEKLKEAAKKGSGALSYGSGIGYGKNGGGVTFGMNEVGMNFMYAPMMITGGRSSGQRQDLDPGKLKAQTAQQQSDNFVRTIFVMLEELLPSFNKSSDFDANPPEAIASLLQNSKILTKAAELLRNDSLDDATKRKPLYDALLNFLRVIGLQSGMAEHLMFGERVVRNNNVNLLNLSFNGDRGCSKEEKAPALADSLRQLNLQSTMMLKHAQKHKSEFSGNEATDMLWLCRIISDLYEELLKTAQLGGGAAKFIEGENLDGGISDCPEKIMSPDYYFTNLARSMTHSPKGRVKRLMTEITTMKTSLPNGIFVKYCDTRMDLMKVLIIGPSGTPYEGGIFEFDILCPTNYPFENPQCMFRTTGGGRAAFNPNLYSSGKVCLSILGTWQGEPWRPHESTILQVLVSIQAMILCEDPWCNEPGQEGQQGLQVSRDYNKQIRRLTVEYAMLSWLERPVNLVWKEIVARHFRKNGSKILQTVSQWQREDAGLSASYSGGYHQTAPGSPLGALIPRLQAYLQSMSSSASGTAAQQAAPSQSAYGGRSGQGAFCGGFSGSGVGGQKGYYPL